MAGILSQGSGTGVLSTGQPRSLLDRLGIDVSSPQMQTALAFANNIIGTPGSSPFAGVAQAQQNAQLMQARKVELAKIVKDEQKQDEQTAALKQMMAGDPMATQLLNAGQTDAAMKYFAQKNGLNPPDLTEVSPGATLFDPRTGKSVFTAPQREGSSSANLPNSYKEFLLAQDNPEYAKSLSSSTTKAPTADQSNAAGFADRMEAAEPIIEQTTNAQTDWGEATKNNVGNIVGVGNYLISPQYQQALQAQRDFVNAVLRKESGAAIGADEFRNAQLQYFPQPGDSPKVLEQKRQNRRIAIEAMKRSGAQALARDTTSTSGGQTFTYNPATGELE